MFSAWCKEFNGDISGAREGYRHIYNKICPGLIHAIVRLANLERRQVYFFGEKTASNSFIF